MTDHPPSWLDAVDARARSKFVLGHIFSDPLVREAVVQIQEDRRHLLRLVGQLRAALRNMVEGKGWHTIDGICSICDEARKAVAACDAATPEDPR